MTPDKNKTNKQGKTKNKTYKEWTALGPLELVSRAQLFKANDVVS